MADQSERTGWLERMRRRSRDRRERRAWRRERRRGSIDPGGAGAQASSTHGAHVPKDGSAGAGGNAAF